MVISLTARPGNLFANRAWPTSLDLICAAGQQCQAGGQCRQSSCARDLAERTVGKFCSDKGMPPCPSLFLFWEFIPGTMQNRNPCARQAPLHMYCRKKNLRNLVNGIVIHIPAQWPSILGRTFPEISGDLLASQWSLGFALSIVVNTRLWDHGKFGAASLWAMLWYDDLLHRTLVWCERL